MFQKPCTLRAAPKPFIQSAHEMADRAMNKSQDITSEMNEALQ
jgi:hypothetical protein